MIPKVSVIVPVFNAGERLCQCLDSLTNQTLKEIEIIIVLDCPTDGSDKVAEHYASKDSRIKLIRNKENLNIGFSRNEGLKIAQGEYVGFSDHDDYCEPQMFEHLYRNATDRDADIVISDIGEDINAIKHTTGFPENSDNFRESYLRSLINGSPFKRGTHSFDNCNSIWNQIYRRTFLQENNVTFSDNRVVTYEDSLFLIKAYSLAKSVSYIPETLYYHVETGENEYHSYSYRSITKVCNYLYEMIEFLKGSGDAYRQEISNSVFQRIFTSLLNELHFKGLCAFFKAMRQVRSNISLITCIKSPKPSVRLTFAKRLVLKHLNG